MRCTMQNIADALGLTKNTVSHALKNKSDISVATRELVQKTACEMGYIPNIAAASLRGCSSKTIGVLFDSLTNPYYAIMTELLLNAFSKHGYSLLMFCDNTPDSYITVDIARKVISHGADALISFLQIDQEVGDLLTKMRIPALVLGRDSSGVGVDSICTDDVEGGYLAAKHLVEIGRKKILNLSALDTITCSQHRREGARRAFEEAQYPIDAEAILRLGIDGNSGTDLMRKADALGLEYDALLCFNDRLAFEALDYMIGKGVRCPEDVAIVGYDNLQKFVSFPYRLTTIDTDNQQTVDVAVEVLIHKIKHENEKHKPFNKISGVKLIKGFTT